MRSDKTKKVILEVASKMFARFGFHKTTIDEIARLARKAKGSVYYHFTDKEDLFKEVVLQEIQTIKSGLLIILNNQEMTPPEKIKTYLIRRLALIANAVNYQATLTVDFIEHYDFIEDIKQDYLKWDGSNIKKVFAEGIEQQYFEETDNLDVLIDVFMLVIKGLEGPLFEQKKYQELLPHFDSMLNIMIKGILKT